MLRFTFSFLLMSLCGLLAAQNGANVQLELRTGLQSTDQRTLLDENQVDNLRATYVGLSLHTSVLGKSSRTKFWAGLSLGMEQHHFNRDIIVDFCRFCAFCNCVSSGIPTRVDSYRQYIVGVPLDVRYQLADRWNIRMEYRPDFVFGKREIGGMNASWSGFELLDHSLRPSVQYQIGRCQIGLAANFRTGRTLDPFYYEQFLRNGLIESSAEFFDFAPYRPLRFDLSFAYGL